jgi:hypothetical protein
VVGKQPETIKKESAGDPDWLLWIILSVLILALWVWLGFFLPFRGGDLESRARQGDAFGGANALFSGLAFAGVIIAILLQRQELRLQRKELTETRGELSGQREALEAQVLAASQQRFDSIFFQMVGLHHEIVNGINIVTGKTTFVGRQALTLVQSRVIRDLSAVPQDELAVNDLARLSEQVAEVRHAYREVYDRHETILGHYFRNLYRIFKYVDEADVADKASYIGILRAQLSVSELCLVFYNLFDQGYDKFLPLCERYQFLQNLPASELASPVHAELLQRHRRHVPGWLQLAD